MKQNWENMEKIAEGNEKEVYLHPDNPEKVISRFKEGRSERETELTIKGRYYLAKIMHLLMPANIPDTNFVAKGDDVVIISERKNLDNEHLEHNRIKSLLNRKMAPEQKNITLDSEIKLGNNRIEALEKDERFLAFEEKMEKLGVRFDEYPTNFGNDENNNLIYIDNSFRPWHDLRAVGGRILKNYYAPAIRAAIMSIDVSERNHALNYLQRLEELYSLWKEECDKGDKK